MGTTLLDLAAISYSVAIKMATMTLNYVAAERLIHSNKAVTTTHVFHS